MSPQNPNRGSDLPGRESAENPTPVRDERRTGVADDTSGSTGDGRKPGRRRLGPALIAVVVGLLSFDVGLRLFAPPKSEEPAAGLRPVSSSKADAPAERVGKSPPKM